jgi:hypothetical protein
MEPSSKDSSAPSSSIASNDNLQNQTQRGDDTKVQSPPAAAAINTSDSSTSSPSPSALTLTLSANKTPGCTCKKSKCLKLYCQCFAASALCDADICKCESCKNEVSREKDIKRARSNVLYRNPRAFEGKFIENKAAKQVASNVDNGNGNSIAPNSMNAGGRPIQPFTQMANGKFKCDETCVCVSFNRYAFFSFTNPFMVCDMSHLECQLTTLNSLNLLTVKGININTNHCCNDSPCMVTDMDPIPPTTNLHSLRLLVITILDHLYLRKISRGRIPIHIFIYQNRCPLDHMPKFRRKPGISPWIPMTCMAIIQA